ncbi:MAG: MFS transporter, partial [Cyanobacteria bacterium]|nr:MFS transporter [Cyanobacteriota bacterium]
GINSASFLAAIITLKMINITKVLDETKKAGGAGAAGGKEPGVFAVLFSPSIRYILMLSAATSIFGFQYGVLLPMIVDHNLGGNATTLGLLSASAGVGALVGSLALANRGGRSKGLRRGIGFACLTLSTAILSIAFSPWLWLSMASAALAGTSISVQLSGSTSIVQSVVRDGQRGRVMGVFSTFMVGFTPIAAMIAGWLADSIGVKTTLVIAAAALSSIALLYLFLSRNVPANGGDNAEEKPS